MVRVTFDRSGETAVTARGPADVARTRPVTADDPVRWASVSKLVVGLGVMRLIEAGRVELDRDVSDYLGTPLRHPEHPATPITLRLLLSHRAGLSDAGERYVVPYGARLGDVLADREVWADAQGTRFRYANLGFPVIASVLERATGERFDRLMMREVLGPLGLAGCFGWASCDPAVAARAVALVGKDGQVRRDGPGDLPPACPVFTQGACDLAAYRLGENGAVFSPQGGLRLSARGMARIGRMLLNGGEGFLTPASIETLLTPAWRLAGANGESEGGFYCQYGLASMTLPTKGCRDDLFGDGRVRVGHAGEAYGLRSGLWLDRARGRGVAFFVTAVADGPGDGRHSAYSRAEERAVRE